MHTDMLRGFFCFAGSAFVATARLQQYEINLLLSHLCFFIVPMNSVIKQRWKSKD